MSTENEPDDTSNPAPGCGCLGAGLGFVILSGIANELGLRPLVAGGGEPGGWYGALIGAPIGLVLGALFAGQIYGPLRGWSKQYGSLVVWSALLVLGLAAAGLVEGAFVAFGRSPMPKPVELRPVGPTSVGSPSPQPGGRSAQPPSAQTAATHAPPP